MKATATTSISFGLVNVPVKVYTATRPSVIRFNMVTKSGSRLKIKYVDTAGKEVSRDETIKGYEFAKGQYVHFTPEELEAIAGSIKSSSSMEIIEFVDFSEIDRIGVEKSYYLGPDKGGEKPFTLLSHVMHKLNVVAIAKWTTRNKEHLVSIRACKNGGINGLVMEQLLYADEIKDFSEIGVSGLECSEAELELAEQLVKAKTSKSFDLSQYKDEYAAALMGAIQRKVSGQEINVPASPKKTSVIDLFDALKASLSNVG